jgi:hypothetical protein
MYKPEGKSQYFINSTNVFAYSTNNFAKTRKQTFLIIHNSWISVLYIWNWMILQRYICSNVLKGDQWEKRGLTVVSFDRSGFKLFSLWFSNKSMQAPSCERHKLFSEPCFYYLQTIIDSQSFPTSDKNCWRYLNFADFLETKGRGQYSLEV